MSACRFPHRPGPPGFASKPCAPHAQMLAGFRCQQLAGNPLCRPVATIKKGQKLPMARSDSGRLRWCRPPVARLSHAHRPSRPCVGGPDPWRVADSEKQRPELDPVRKGVSRACAGRSWGRFDLGKECRREGTEGTQATEKLKSVRLRESKLRPLGQTKVISTATQIETGASPDGTLNGLDRENAQTKRGDPAARERGTRESWSHSPRRGRLSARN